jgi:hypothetical protein
MRNRYLLMLLLAPALIAQVTAPAVDDTGTVVAFAIDGDLYLSKQGSETLRVASGGITEVAPSPDGHRAAFAAGGAVRVLDLATGEERRVADGKAVVLSGDGSRAALTAGASVYTVDARLTIE